MTPVAVVGAYTNATLGATAVPLEIPRVAGSSLLGPSVVAPTGSFKANHVRVRNIHATQIIYCAWGRVATSSDYDFSVIGTDMMLVAVPASIEEGKNYISVIASGANTPMTLHWCAVRV